MDDVRLVALAELENWLLNDSLALRLAISEGCERGHVRIPCSSNGFGHALRVGQAIAGERLVVDTRRREGDVVRGLLRSHGAVPRAEGGQQTVLHPPQRALHCICLGHRIPWAQEAHGRDLYSCFQREQAVRIAQRSVEDEDDTAHKDGNQRCPRKPYALDDAAAEISEAGNVAHYPFPAPNDAGGDNADAASRVVQRP
eukprot:scaffold1435_cov267-Pinguiococcus_pyrenoidosus.AAC.18